MTLPHLFRSLLSEIKDHGNKHGTRLSGVSYFAEL